MGLYLKRKNLYLTRRFLKRPDIKHYQTYFPEGSFALRDFFCLPLNNLDLTDIPLYFFKKIIFH